MTRGTIVNANATFTNTGSMTWQSGGSNPVAFSYRWRTNGCGSQVADGIIKSLTSNVSPGGTVSNLSIQIAAPSTPGTYCLEYDLAHLGVTWFSAQGAAVRQMTVTVN
jgi:hypothetical protein